MRFLDKFANPKKLSGTEDAGDAILRHLAHVRSVRDCFDILEAASMFQEGTLREDAVSALYSHCAVMRRQGMAMEPNLIGRAVTRAIAEPVRAGEAALRFAGHDTDFIEIVAKADEMRSKRDFSQAEYQYWLAHLLYPKHPLILVQYAHALKEQGKFPDALARYLDAAAFGAPMSDVEEHALFVAGALGLKARVAELLLAPTLIPISTDVRALYELLIGREPAISDVVLLMIEHRSAVSIVTTLMRREEFSQANRELLRLVAETQWSEANA